jgi:Arc/MetJ family transcription regulator
VKTTVDIADDLLGNAKRRAAMDGTTLRDLVEAGLRRELAARSNREFTLVDASYTGSGTQPGIQEGDWQTWRDLIYEGRGG